MLRKYGTATTVVFTLYQPDGVDLETGASFSAGDVKLMKDEGAEGNSSNLPVDEGQGYSLALTAAEMQAARVVIYLVDQSNPKAWLDTAIVIETYGDASGQHAFDLDRAVQEVDLSAAGKADVNAECDTALGDYDGPTNAEMVARTLSSSDYADKATVDTVAGRIGSFSGTGVNTILGFLRALMRQDGGTSTPTDVGGSYDHTTDSLEAVRDRGDAAWGGAGSETVLDSGTAQAGGSNTITLAATASATDDYYNRAIVAITGGTGAGQSDIIDDYAGSTRVATIVGTWATPPDNTSTYKVLPFGSVPGATAPTAGQVADAVLDELVADHQSAGSLGSEVHLAKAMLANKRVHTVSTGVDQVMDDDGVTLLRTMTPSDGGDDTIEVEPS